MWKTPRNSPGELSDQCNIAHDIETGSHGNIFNHFATGIVEGEPVVQAQKRIAVCFGQQKLAQDQKKSSLSDYECFLGFPVFFPWEFSLFFL